MGDDLVAAREFSNLCHNNLVPFLTAQALEKSDVVKVLKTIRQQAKKLRARAIVRASQNAIDEFCSARSGAQSAGALLRLNKLVCQYTEGLNEVAPLQALSVQDMYDAEYASLSAAREIFAPLQRFAQGPKETALLSRLATMGVTIDGEAAASESFDELMPEITDESLRKARENSKSVSVSYATDDITMDEDLAQDLQSALMEICNGLIQRSIEPPLRRQNQGLSSAAHIAITAKARARMFDVLVTCEGPLPSKTLLQGPVFEVLRDRGVQIRLSSSETLVRVDITGLPVCEPEQIPERRLRTAGMRG